MISGNSKWQRRIAHTPRDPLSKLITRIILTYSFVSYLCGWWVTFKQTSLNWVLTEWRGEGGGEVACCNLANLCNMKVCQRMPSDAKNPSNQPTPLTDFPDFQTSWLPHSLTDWLSEWVSDWLTIALRMITEIACDCQLGFSFGYGFNQGKQSKTKKAATIFFATDALFMDPQKRNSFSSLWVQLLCWWARGQLPEKEGDGGMESRRILETKSLATGGSNS